MALELLPASESLDLYFLYDLLEKLLFEDLRFLDVDAIHWLVEVEVELKYKKNRFAWFNFWNVLLFFSFCKLLNTIAKNFKIWARKLELGCGFLKFFK